MIKNTKNLLYLLSIVFLLTVSACSGTKKTQTTNTEPNRMPQKTFSAKGEGKIDSAEIERLYIDGCKFLATDDIEKAVNAFGDILKVDPNNTASMFQLSTIYFKYGQLGDAQNYIKNAVALEPKNIYYQLLYADILSYSASFDKAAEVYENILKDQAFSEEVYYRLAYSYEKAGKKEDAIKTMQRLLALEGENESVLFELQRLYAMNDQPDKAIEVLLKLIEIDPYNSGYLRYLSEYYERAGQPELAQQTFDKLLLTDSSNVDLQFRKASFQKKAGDENAYFNTMHKAFANGLGNIDTKIFYLVLFVDSLDKPNFKLKDTVLTWTKLLVEAHPEDAKSFAMRGDFLFYSGELRSAAAAYNKSLNIRSDIYDVWIKMFYIYSDLREFDSLKNVTNSAIELYPNQPLGYYFNGVAFNNINDADAAIKTLKRGLPLTVSNTQLRADIFTELGNAYNDVKNYVESDKAFENSLQLNPDNPFTLNNYAYFLSVRNENLERAAEMSAASIKLVPDNASLEDTYAWILYKQKKYKDAKLWMEKALAHGGKDSGTVLEHYGDILYQLGDKDQAVEYWIKAKAAGDASDLIDKKINDKTLYE